MPSYDSSSFSVVDAAASLRASLSKLLRVCKAPRLTYQGLKFAFTPFLCWLEAEISEISGPELSKFKA